MLVYWKYITNSCIDQFGHRLAIIIFILLSSTSNAVHIAIHSNSMQ